MRKSNVLALGLLAIVAVVVWLSRSDGAHVETGIKQDVSPEAGGTREIEMGLAATDAKVRTEGQAELVTKGTPSEIMSKFMGRSLPELEEEYGVDLSRVLEPGFALIAPERATEYFLQRVGAGNERITSARYRQLIDWPGWSYWSPPRIPLGNMAETTWQWLHHSIDVELPEGKSEAECIATADTLADSWNFEIDSLARQYIEIMNSLYEAKLASGDFVQYPAALFAPENKVTKQFEGGGRSASVGGWKMKAVIDERASLELVAIKGQIADLIKKRNTAVRKALR